MVIELRGPGVGSFGPDYRSTPLFSGYSNLQRSLQAPYYEDYVNRAAGFRPMGSIQGGPTLGQALDLQAPDPKKWTTIAPPKAVAGSILGASGKPGGSKLGSFNLDMIYPWESLHDATTKNVGLPEQSPDTTLFGGAGPSVFGVKPIDVLNWQGELPVKLMERPLALAQVLAQRLTGGGPIQADPEGNAAYPFQKDPAYWQWLGKASDGELEQQARAVASSYLSYGRNQALVDTLLQRFKSDRDVALGKTSGVDTVDYTAKKRVQQELNLYHTWQHLNTQAPATHWDPNAQGLDPTQGHGAYVPGPDPSWRAVADPGFQAWLGSNLGKDFSAVMTLDNPSAGDDTFGALLNMLPLVGTQAAQAFAGPTDEAMREWDAMPMQQRQKYLQDAGFTTIVTSLATALPLFGGLGAIGMAAKASSIPTIAAMGRAWALTLRAANVSMALGLGVTTAAWAGENFAPYADQREFFRDVNLADPVGHSALGGVLNTVGMMSSGTFGTALALKASARALGALDRGTVGISGRLFGTHEVPYYTDVFGGSQTTDALFKYAGVEQSSSKLSFSRSLLNFLTHGAVRESEEMYRRVAAGEATGIEAIDALEPAARMEWAAQQIERTYSATPGLIAQMVERIGRARAKDPLVPTHEEQTAYATNSAIVRNLVDTATREHISQYGDRFFGADRTSIREQVQASLTRLGYTPDMAGFDQTYGKANNVKTLQRWLQLARAVHQLEYSVKDAQLFEHLKAENGTHEQGATLFSQRTLSAQDIEAALPVLRGADPAAALQKASELLSTKLRVKEAYALGEFGDGARADEVTPATADVSHLADYLEAILQQNGAPRMRDLPVADAPTADLPLNAFHRRLVDEGQWTIGFRARAPMAEAVPFSQRLDQLIAPFEMFMLEPEKFILRDVAPGTVPDGYIEIPPGIQLQRKNWYELDPILSSDGRYFVRDDGTIDITGGQQANSGIRPSNNAQAPYPIDQNDPIYWDTLTDAQKTLARNFKQPHSAVTPGLDQLYIGDLEQTGEVMSGRNAGADWPILRHRVTGDRYLFKARRNPGGPLSDLSEARRLAGPTATRLLASLGLHVAEEKPIVYDGLKGTIQKLVDVEEPVDLRDLGKYSAEVHNEVLKQHIGDWLTGQYDSNSDSMLLGKDGFVYGVDKGQAYKYTNGGELDDRALLNNFWGYRTRDAADLHLGEYLERAIDAGTITLDRQAVEELVTAIEALPEDVYLASLQELAAARVADGRFENYPSDFFKWAVDRKRNIRQGVNNAFLGKHYMTIEKPGSLPHWTPGQEGRIDLGTSTWLNERPVPLEELYAHNDAHPVDEPSGDAVSKAGVVVQEPDGRVWIINPKGNFAGYVFTWPKGHVNTTGNAAAAKVATYKAVLADLTRGVAPADTALGAEIGKLDAYSATKYLNHKINVEQSVVSKPSETLQRAAIREAFEETGLSVRLKAHLTDQPNENGVVTRYYLAERVAGGPQFVGTPDEIGSIVLVHERDLGTYLHRNGGPDPRDNAVAAELAKYHADEQAKASAKVEGADTPDTADPAQDPGPTPETAMGYVSHVKLPNGAIWRTPWLDANLREAAQIELGNRGIAGRAYDTVFRSWRSWRLLETQKAGLHFSLVRDFEMGPATAEKVDLLYAKLLDIQRKTKGGSIQAIAGVHPEMPWVGAYATEVAAAAKEIFGEGPFLSKRTGKLEAIDFNRVIANSFRQSLRLNFTAGLTSYLKTVPGLGQIILPITDFAYPLLRFHISPLFKAGEYVESAMLNGMRGVQRTGDPFIDALWWKSGAGSGLGVLMEDAGSDMMLANLSSLAPIGSARGRHADAAFFYERPNPADHAAAVAGQLTASDPFTPGKPKGLDDGLSSALEIPDPAKFPDRYSEMTPRKLLRDLGVDPNTGEPLLDLRGGDASIIQVQRVRNEIVGSIGQRLLDRPEDAPAIGAGMAFLAALPPGTIERMAETLPLVHTPVTKTGGTTSAQIGYARRAINEGFPAFSGRLSTGDYALQTTEGHEGTIPGAIQVNYGKSDTTISQKEQWSGFADAKYGSMAAGYETGSGSLLVILKPEKLRDSVTTNTDRIALGNDVLALQDAMMTPAAVQSISRLYIQKMILDWHRESPELTFREFMEQSISTYFSGTSPFEMAYMNGIKFEDISAVMLDHKATGEWSDLVATYKDHPNAQGLDSIDVIPYDPSYDGRGYRPAMVARWLDQAGVADLTGVRPDLSNPDAAMLALPPITVTPATVGTMGNRIVTAAARVGIRADLAMSHLDRISVYRNDLSKDLVDAKRDLGVQKSTPKHYTARSLDILRERIRAIETRISEVDAIATDARALNARGAATEDELAPILARMKAVGMVQEGVGPVGSIRIVDIKTGEVLSEHPLAEQPPVAMEFGANHTGANSPTPTLHYDVARAQALLEAYQERVPTGYATADPKIIPANATREVQSAIDTPELRAAIRARAEAKMGHDLADPVIRAYVRGHEDRITGDPYRSYVEAGVNDLIVSVLDTDGQPYGNLTLGELGELWTQYGFPADFKARADAAGYAFDASGDLGGKGLLFHGPGPRPEGRMYYYLPTDLVGGAFEKGPAGLEWQHPQAEHAFDVQMGYAFNPAGESYVDLANAIAFRRSSAKVTKGAFWNEHRTVKTVDPNVTQVDYERTWGYRITEVPGGAARDVQIDFAHHDDNLPTMLRDIFQRTADLGPTRLKLTNREQVSAFEALFVKGEVPDHIVATDQVGDVLDVYRVVRDMSTKELVDLLPEPPASSFEEVKGTPESVQARLAEQWRSMGGKGKRAADALMNPVPYKQVAMDKLTFHIARETFAPVLKAENPRAAGVFAELKVPEHKWADFLLQDRHLLSRFKETGSRGDFEALVQHASKYTGKADYMATQKSLDELYTSPDFEVMLETWRGVIKAAQDESYGVHFFAPYRSTFERTINHPVFGIYPASWSLKIAKEWFKFLYQNTTLGFRAGMMPAALIRQVTQAQAKVWAQSNPETLDQFWQKGPLSSSAFIFNLLLPGDWSSVPFPFSRTIRDIARGTADPVSLFVNNMTSMGIGRDIRLGSEAAGEIGNVLRGEAGHGSKFKNAGSISDVEGLPQGAAQPSYARAESVKDVYAAR